MRSLKLSDIFLIAALALFSFSCNAQEDRLSILSVEEVESVLAEDSGVLLVDVRTPEEFQQGHIEGALNIDYFDPDFKKRMDTFDKEEAIYIYCRSGNRSQKAADILKDLGFKEIYDLEGGYRNWKK